MLIILNNYPPHQKAIEEHIPEFKKHLTCTFGPILYNPKKVDITPERMAHEMEHSKQQTTYGYGRFKLWKHSNLRVEEWWNRYLQDETFRFAMELPASQREWWEFQKYETDRNKLAVKKEEIAHRLTNKLYGKKMKIGEALKFLDRPRLIKLNV